MTRPLPAALRRRELRVVGLDDADDDAEDPERRREDLDDEDFHEERRVLRVRERAGRAGDAHGDAARDVGQPDADAGREERVAREIPLVVVPVLRQHARLHLRAVADLGEEEDREDDAVDGRRLAEDDGDEVLGPDPRRLDGRADERRPRQPDAPGRADDRQPEAERDAHVRPRVRAHVREELVVRRVTVLALARLVAHRAGAGRARGRGGLLQERGGSQGRRGERAVHH
mmetsp:Transcript_11322/g.34845  ORF Transcript_11322/g.34845 Transcript_11322/m.34845 type:complete len:230 (-) Transcript_11322:168-857(-)